MRRLSRLAAGLFVLSIAPALSAQEAPRARSAADPAITVQHLDAMLVPMTSAELEVEVKAWRDVLQAKAEEIARARIASANADVSGLVRERGELVTKFDRAVRAFEAKGGDVTEYDKYKAVVDELDVSSLWITVVDWSTDAERGLGLAMNLGKFLLTLLAFKILAGVVAGLIKRAMSRVRNVSDLLRSFFVNVVRKLIFLIGLVVALSFLGINVGPFLAAIGAVGFIIGFALQGTLSNFASGIMILLYRPYDIGDVVTAAGTTGKVEAMTLVSTSLLTPDNQRVVVPNGSIWGNTITNITANDTRRVDLKFGISYSDDIDKAMRVLEDVVTSHPLVLKDPAPAIKVHELADSSVNFVVRPWSKTSDYWDVYWDTQRAVKQRFDAEGISIPFPQRDVHMRQAVTA